MLLYIANEYHKLEYYTNNATNKNNSNKNQTMDTNKETDSKTLSFV